jgi:eukaryotic-like serine/threonine-protein kinase
MPVARWERIKELFQAAREQPVTARAAYLAEACGDDLELRRELESLLTAERDAGGFLSAAGDVPAGARRGRGPPHRPLPRPRQDRQGGMGVVYRVVRDDDVFQKTVALKLVHGGARPEHLRRLAKERQILARLQHPNIATILDGGTTEEGLPYLIMEHVEGEPLDAYCNTRGLGTGRRLEMFRTVCGAVHYAHQNLLVHRDLKPGNILVTADGQPKLLDSASRSSWLRAWTPKRRRPRRCFR